MGSVAMKLIPNSIKIDSGIQSLKGGYIDTQTARKPYKATYIFFRKREVR
jgi:hypothetical protein